MKFMSSKHACCCCYTGAVTHALRMVNASYIDAATKHKQAKQGSLGTELAPQAKYIHVINFFRERENACA